MPRPSRAFQPGSFELEGRMLLSRGPSLLRSRPSSRADTVGFSGPAVSGDAQVVMQQGGDISVSANRMSLPRLNGPTPPPLRLRIDTVPSPAVGVNVGEVHETVTLEWAQPSPTATIPIIRDAPNPGEVDVTLTITPINPPPDLKVHGPLVLRVLASRDVLPPSIENAYATPTAIAVKFTKPMDPAGASNVKNYSVKAMARGGAGGGGMDIDLGDFFGISDNPSLPTPPPVRIQSARYDPATQTVNLATKRKLNFKAWTYSLSPGHASRARGGRGRLADLRGQPLDVGPGVPGRYSFGINPPA